MHLKGHLEIVRCLGEAGADKVKTDKAGTTPLHMHLGMVALDCWLLCEAGADKDKASDIGATPLYVASQNGHLEVVRMLGAAGADKDGSRRVHRTLTDNPPGTKSTGNARDQKPTNLTKRHFGGI